MLSMKFINHCSIFKAILMVFIFSIVVGSAVNQGTLSSLHDCPGDTRHFVVLGPETASKSIQTLEALKSKQALLHSECLCLNSWIT